MYIRTLEAAICCSHWARIQRSFSALRRLKTYIRSTMSVSRLDHVTVLHIHKTLTDELNINSIVNEFASANDTRKDMFG